MFVKVCYYDEKIGGYPARTPYTYYTELDLQPANQVIAPTVKNANQRGVVVDIDVPAPSFTCREITQRYVPDDWMNPGNAE